MMLHEYPEDFQALIRATSQNLGIRELYIEKDYWVTLILKRLSQIDDVADIVFKGGTSLSKAYGILRRFSEDIDLAVAQRQRTNSQVKRFIETSAKKLTLAPFQEIEENGTTSKKGRSRKTLHQYPRLLSDRNFGPARNTLLLEINCFGEPFPSSQKQIRSFIGDYLHRSGTLSVIDEYELGPFEVFVLDYRTTFIEKVLALSYAAFDEYSNGRGEIEKKIRHFYDLTVLLRQEDIKRFLEGSDFGESTERIRADEILETRSKWSEQKLVTSPLISQTDSVLATIERAYIVEMRPMVFKEEDLPTFEEVRSAIKQISATVLRLGL